MRMRAIVKGWRTMEMATTWPEGVYAEWYERCRNVLLGRLHNQFPGNSDIEDAVQEALARAWNKGWEYFSRFSSFVQWACTAARNWIIDRIRRDQTTSLPHDPPDERPADFRPIVYRCVKEQIALPEPERTAMQMKREGCALRVIGQKISDDEPERTVIEMKLEGCALREIGERISDDDASEPTLVQRARRAYHRAKLCCGPTCGANCLNAASIPMIGPSDCWAADVSRGPHLVRLEK